ncbi:MAG: sodium ion-translocating decarboxylase subunit beta [Planctomycetota bacterium]|jgi:sodium ion-translocating decarboxylase beta subunit|nr:sodium ion-translocating decarboxylase subunit beta [Planctomycetota bacterium]
MLDALLEYFGETGFVRIEWQMVVMWLICAVLLYLAVYKKYEPLLLMPIAFGALLANLPTAGVVTGYEPGQYMSIGQGHGLFDIIYLGIHAEIFPPLIFLGVGALTDFGPLIANPRTLLLGGAANIGVLITFFCAWLFGYEPGEAASIGIIGGADGPTSIFTANKLAPHLMGPIAVAAYTYMSLVPLIQPPIMRLLTTDAERKIRMKSLRQVGKLERMVFAVMVCITVILLVPAAAALVGMLMLGNFMRECGVVERLLKTSQNELINLVTILLGTAVGMTMHGSDVVNPETGDVITTGFLSGKTMGIITIGIAAFSCSTACGVLMAKGMNLISSKNPINPLIGAAGVSAVPMAARVAQDEGRKWDPHNYLLMHAMGPNVAGVIGTAVVAGYFIATLS